MAAIDDWMPVFDEATCHSLLVHASPDAVWDALFMTDFSTHPVTRLLLALRSVPLFLSSPRRTLRRVRTARASPTKGIGSFLSGEFVLLEKDEPAGIVLGLTGRFWTPTGGLHPTEPSTFRDEVPPGLARAAWAFRLDPSGSGTTLTTETRVRCGGKRARRAFRAYWTLIRPFSGLIRVIVLGQVKRRAEAAGERSG